MPLRLLLIPPRVLLMPLLLPVHILHIHPILPLLRTLLLLVPILSPPLSHMRSTLSLRLLTSIRPPLLLLLPPFPLLRILLLAAP
jgi:hypothetical protein